MNRKQKKRIELEAQLAENRKIVEKWLREGDDHKMPVTRRDFLSAGVTATIGAVAAPSIYSILDKLNRAHGADCSVAGAVQDVPYINIGLSGGWGGVGAWVPFTLQGDKLEAYTTLTKGPNPDIRTDVFGNGARFYVNDNSFVDGILATANAAVRANTAFIGFPSRSNDDTGNNELDPSGIITQAGLAGSALPTLEDVRHRAAFGINRPASLNVNRFNDLAGALGFAGALGNLDSNQLPRFAQLVMDLNTRQARDLASLSGGANITDLMECATQQNHNNIANQSVDAINPQNDAAVQGIFDLNNNNELARAAIVYNALKGTAGASTLEFGGYDYHGSSKAQEQQRDRDAGERLGQILSMAAALQQKVFITILSDGAVSGQDPAEGGEWRSDSGSRSCQFVIVYDPAGLPATTQLQVGGFTNGQVADRSFTTGDDPARVSAAIALNWAAFSGDINKVLRVLPNNTFSQAQIDQVLAIAT